MKLRWVFYIIKKKDGGILHLIDIGVPHLTKELEGRWGVWVINRELDLSLDHRTGNVYYLLVLVLLTICSHNCLKLTVMFNVAHHQLKNMETFRQSDYINKCVVYKKMPQCCNLPFTFILFIAR